MTGPDDHAFDLPYERRLRRPAPDAAAAEAEGHIALLLGLGALITLGLAICADSAAHHESVAPPPPWAAVSAGPVLLPAGPASSERDR